MTHHPDKAREAAHSKFNAMAQRDNGGWPINEVECVDAAIDAFLAKALEGADEKLAEIRERNKALGGHFPRNTLSTMHLWANELYADNTALLALVTALSAKQQDDKDEIARLNMSIELLSADKATFAKAYTDEKARADAQKAAHAKMLRDEVGIAINDVISERKRQIEVEGWSPKHDDKHDYGEIARAAAAYALVGSWPTDKENPSLARNMEELFGADSYVGRVHLLQPIGLIWPWDWKWWKPTNRRRNLVKAGALIIAEIERLDRLADKIEGDL